MPKPHGALGYRPPAPETVPHHRPVPAFAHEGLDANLTLRVPGTTRVGAIADPPGSLGNLVGSPAWRGRIQAAPGSVRRSR